MNSLQHQQCADRLFKLIQQQSGLVGGYIEYLYKIKQAITHGDSEQLNQLLTENKIDIGIIESSQSQQAELLEQHGYETTENGLENCIQDCHKPELTELRQSLVRQLKKLEKSLLINELLIQKNQDRIRQSIRILSGHGAVEPLGTYSRMGNKDNNHENKHSLAMA